MSGSTGVLPAPKGYLPRLRQICDKHGILLIFDEVITAWGRLGYASAAERLGITPDLITMAKGLTSAHVPMGAVVQSTATKQPIEQVLVYPGKDAEFTLYDDDGKSYDYEKSRNVSSTRLRWSQADGKLSASGDDKTLTGNAAKLRATWRE